MGVDVSERRDQQDAKAAKPAAPGPERGDAPSAPPPSGWVARILNLLLTGLRELEWGPVLLFGTIAGIVMSLAFLQGTALTVVAGIVPVGTGLLLGRRVKGHYALHGVVTGMVGGVASLVSLAVLIFLTPLGPTIRSGLDPTGTLTLLETWTNLAGFTAFSLIAFCAFGTTMSGRTEERNRKAREVVDTRGGTLQRPGTIRGADDVRGLSLPQFGTYVKNVFTKQGFQFKDYRFVDKDKHLDLWFDHEDEPWHLRLSVADKVSPGTIEGLMQEMRREGCRKGIVVTSTEFMPSATKAAKGRPIVLIDGPTLYEIAEK